MPTFANPVIYAIPAFAALLLLEMLLNKRGKGYAARDTATSLLMGIGNQLLGLLTVGIVYVIAANIWAFAPVQLGYDWWVWILCFIGADFAYYWFHRCSHRVRWFWAAHVNHHSSEHYNLSTALRQTWTGFITISFIFYWPLFLLGFPPAMVYFCHALNLIYQFWFHTEAIDKMPRWFEAVMNTPSHHRVHHATNPRYLDANYAGVFIVWDRIFGSFVAEDDADRVEYGLVNNLGSHNLFIVAFHEWLAIARDIWHAPLRHKLSYLLREPGWSHDGSRETSAMIKARAKRNEVAPPDG